MTNEEREALEWLQSLPVANPGTKVADHVATILLMLAARDPVAAMIARNLNRPKPSRADEPDERSRPGDSS
jgi:hypothetical protein